MKHLPTIAGVLLGLPFCAFGLDFFLNFIPKPPGPPPDSPAAMFMGALIPTGYFAAVKTCEILGGLLVALPRTRNLGLLILGPIIFNILCFNLFIMKGTTLLNPVIVAIPLLALFLLWSERRAFWGLVCR